VSVDYAGNILSLMGAGIDAQSIAGPVEAINAGNVRASSYGVAARGSGTATIVQTGDVTSTNNIGIYGLSLTSTVEITSVGDLRAASSGIFAKTQGNASAGSDVGIDIYSLGDIEAGLIGTSARVYGNANGNDSNAGIQVVNRGDVVSHGAINAGAIYVATLGVADGDRSNVGVDIEYGRP
jgi:hypothetical protein